MVTPRIIISNHTTKKIKKSTLAMAAAPLAISVKPKIAATIATIRNMNDQRNISYNLG